MVFKTNSPKQNSLVRVCVCVGGGGGGGWCISLKITFKGCVKKQPGISLNENGKWRIDYQNDQTSLFWGSRAYFEDFLWGILKLFQSAAYRKQYLKCLEKCQHILWLISSFKVTRPSFFGRVPSYFGALWYPHLYFYRKSNIEWITYRSINNIR